MRATEHPDYQLEALHLQHTLEQITLWQRMLEQREVLARSEIEEILQQLSDAKKPEDMTTAQLHEMERLQNSLSRRATLELARKDPYFGRLDVVLLNYVFKRNLSLEKIATAESAGGDVIDAATYQTLYLGKVGVGEENGQSQLIVDWRAPIADLYYAGIHGLTRFEGPYGPIEVDLELLRRLLVRDGQLLEIADQEEAAGIDDYLLSRLRENAGTGMKDIISTIQQNQNEIIRLPSGQPVVVQGAAGSGKTSVALHRLSYLLYIRRKEVFPEDTLILTPSRLFFGYIASVMPDLDIKRCRQMTFSELALSELTDTKFTLTSSVDWMSRYCDRSNAADPAMDVELRMLKAKGSMAMLRGIDRYARFLESVVMPEQDLRTASDSVLVSHADMLVRYQDLRFLTLERRAEEMHRWLKVMVKKWLTLELQRIRDYYETRLDIARRRWPPHMKDKPNPKAIELLDAREKAIAKAERESKEALVEYRRQIPKRFALLDLYQGFYESADDLCGYVPTLDRDIAEAMVAQHQRSRTKLMQEDLALLLRLKEHLHGLNLHCALTVIDEAQDMNPAEFAMIRRFLNGGAAITAVGDLAQRIYPQRGLDDWVPLMDEVLDGRDISYREMHRSYRSSSEIIALANHLLRDQPRLANVEGVRETGHLPIAVSLPEQTSSFTAKARVISDLLARWQKQDINTIAIMAKSPNACKQLYRQLQKTWGAELSLIEKESDSYNSPIIILPVHLAKGLEFDAAIIADAESTCYNTGPTDRALLYVALTRPLHQLAYLHAGDITPFLADLPAGLAEPYSPMQKVRAKE